MLKSQELLNRTTYAEGTIMQDHIMLLRTRKAAIDNLSTTPMSNETWCSILIRSIPPTPKWLPVIPSLYILTSPADIISMLLAHSLMILNRDDENECANPNCKARIHSTHTTGNCYWPGSGKDGQFPPNFGQRSKGNVVMVDPRRMTQHYALSARTYRQSRPDYTLSEILINDH